MFTSQLLLQLMFLTLDLPTAILNILKMNVNGSRLRQSSVDDGWEDNAGPAKRRADVNSVINFHFYNN